MSKRLSQKDYYDYKFEGMWCDAVDRSREKIKVTDSSILDSGSIVGLKVMVWKSVQDTTCFKEHIIRIIEEMSSVYLLKYFCYFEENHNFHVVTEFCDDKNLYMLLTDRMKLKSPFSGDDLKKMVGQLATALFILHRGENKNPHGALTTQNIFVSDDLEIKIDFGNSAVVESMTVRLSTRKEETPIVMEEYVPRKTVPIRLSIEAAEEFVAPELKKNSNVSGVYTEKSDVYSMGMVFKKIALVNELLTNEKSAELDEVIKGMLCVAVEDRLCIQREAGAPLNSLDLVSMPYIRSAVLALPWNTLPAALCEAYGLNLDDLKKK